MIHHVPTGGGIQYLVAYSGMVAGELQEQRRQVRFEDRLKFVIFCESYAHLHLTNKLELSGLCRHRGVG
jgi:hypothetical protein